VPGVRWVRPGIKANAALQLSREIGAQYKTAWVLLMKLREAISRRREDVLEGEVEIDGRYAGGHNSHLPPAYLVDMKLRTLLRRDGE
jgi:hypothetical protein